MEQLAEDDFQLEEYVNKCRCCFRSMAEDHKFIKIDNHHINSFFDLTQLKVSKHHKERD